MEYATTFDPISLKTLVPPRLSTKVGTCIEGLERIDIIRCAKDAKAKVNALTFPVSRDGIEDGITEIAEAICACAEFDCAEEGAVYSYEAIFNCTDKQPTQCRFRPSISLRDLEDEVPEDKNPVVAALELAQSMGLSGKNELLSLNQQLAEQNKQLADQLIKMVQINSAVVESQQKTIADLTEHGHDAFKLKDQALRAINTVEIAKLQEDAKAERSLEFISALKQMIPIAGMAVAAALKNKGINIPVPSMSSPEPEDEDEEDEKSAEPPVVDETSNEFKQAKAEEKRNEQLNELLRTQPVAARMYLFKQSLDSDTIMSIMVQLDKKSGNIFKDAMSQTEEADARVHVQKLGALVQSNPKVMEIFQSELSEKQVQTVLSVYQLATVSKPN